jgi:hypothetical protein
MAITVKHKFVSPIPDAGDPNIVQPSNWNDTHELTGLGTMAEQNANSVAITGGTISGVTLPASNITGTLGVPNGGTGATTLTGYVKGTGTTAMTASATIPNTDITGLGTASTKDAGLPLGVATLDAGGKVPVSELPAAVLGALSYQGTWDASTNTPTLTSSVGTKGYYYVVSVAGSTDLNGITDWLIGDWAVYNGTIWQKVDNTETVTSVNGQTGAVVLTTTNIAEGTNEYFTTARARASVSAGTAISYDNSTGVITNAAPDQVVSLTGAGTTSISGTYPNFTITSNDEHDGDVVGPSSATDNAIARYDSTTGKLIQNSLVIVDDTGSVTGVNALTAQSLTVNNNATLGSSNTDSLDVRARISSDLDPETNNAKDIGSSGRNWRDGFFGRTLHTVNLELTGTTSFDGSQGTSGQVLTSAGTGATPTWTTPTVGTVTSVAATAGTGISITGSPITTSGTLNITNTAPDQVVSLTGAGTTSISGAYPNFTITSDDQFDGTVTSVGGTGTVNGISLSGTVTSSGNLTLGGTLSGVSLTTQVTGTLPIANGGTGATTRQNAMDALAGAVTSGQYLRGNGTDVVMSTIQAADVPTLNQNTTGTASNVTGTVAIANGGTGQTSATAAFNALNPMTTTGDIIYESSPTTAARLGIGSTGQVLTVSGGIPAWVTPVTAAAGSNTEVQFNSSGALAGSASYTFDGTTESAPIQRASNGIMTNSKTISASYTIPATDNAMSSGPVTLSGGVTVTVSSGSRWVVL